MTQSAPDSPPYTVSAVSFMNTQPLIAGLSDHPRVRLFRDVPSRLADRLATGQAQVALLPAIDLQRLPGPLEILLGSGGIASDGPVLTVRVFSRVPPEQVRRLCVDTDSHTSVALVAVLWAERYNRGQATPLALQPFDARRDASPADAEAVLMIGDKVVTHPPAGYEYQLDLGEAWRELTGLPFVFAVWAGRRGADGRSLAPLADILAAARDRGVASATQIARADAARFGWPGDLAQRYFTQHLQYVLTDRHRRGLEEFWRLAHAHGLIDSVRSLPYLPAQ